MNVISALAQYARMHRQDWNRQRESKEGSRNSEMRIHTGISRGMGRRIAAVVAAATALVTCVAGASTALADPTTGVTAGTAITLNATDKSMLVGHTFTVYELAKITGFGTESDGSTTYYAPALTTNSDNEPAITTALGNAFSDSTVSGDAMTWLFNKTEGDTTSSSKSDGYAGKVRTFVNDLDTSTMTNQKTVVVTDSDVTANSDGTYSYTITTNEAGVYLITDSMTDTSDTSSTISIPMMAFTKATKNSTSDTTELIEYYNTYNGEIDVKSLTPAITKSVDESSVQQDGTATYTITTTIPHYSTFKSPGAFSYKIIDTLQDGLAYDSTKSVTVTKNTTGATAKTLTSGTEYTVDSSPGLVFDLSALINNAINASDYAYSGATVTITYTAKVSADTSGASDGTYDGLKNSAAIEWTYDSSDTSKTYTTRTTDDPKVFNFSVNIKKQNSAGDALKGAVFTVTDSNGNIVGTATTGEDGKTTFSGLKDGNTYTFTETTFPDGYLNLPDLKFTATIDATYYDADGAAITTSADKQYADHATLNSGTSVNNDTIYGLTSSSFDSTSKVLTVTVTNAKTIAEMSPTGAAGIFMFMTLAVILGGVGIFLYRRSRRA